MARWKQGYGPIQCLLFMSQPPELSFLKRKKKMFTFYLYINLGVHCIYRCKHTHLFFKPAFYGSACIVLIIALLCHHQLLISGFLLHFFTWKCWKVTGSSSVKGMLMTASLVLYSTWSEYQTKNTILSFILTNT